MRILALFLSLGLAGTCFWRLEELRHSNWALHQDWQYETLFIGLLVIMLCSLALFVDLVYRIADDKPRPDRLTK